MTVCGPYAWSVPHEGLLISGKNPDKSAIKGKVAEPHAITVRTSRHCGKSNAMSNFVRDYRREEREEIVERWGRYVMTFRQLSLAEAEHRWRSLLRKSFVVDGHFQLALTHGWFAKKCESKGTVVNRAAQSSHSVQSSMKIGHRLGALLQFALRG
jgi:hypothetical protein